MEAPICLIENITTGELKTNPRALEILKSIEKPLVVIGIVGVYRSGKSYLMNRLAGANGFSVGATMQSHTKGIWMWCIPHPRNPDCCLLLLDTEGLGDVEKEDDDSDNWIFSLAVLLSSVFVYNSKGIISSSAMADLHFITEITERVKGHPVTRKKDMDEIDSFLPDLVWVLRDFTLNLEINGDKITADEYLEKTLMPKSGADQYQQTRKSIRSLFQKRKCFVFSPPAANSCAKDIDECQDGQLNEQFIHQTQSFCSYIFETAKLKTIHGDVEVTGSRFCALVQTYLANINSGSIPCLESTIALLAKTENETAVNEAVKTYKERMEELVKLPTETAEVLEEIHEICKKDATEVFRKLRFKDDGHVFEKKLQYSLQRCLQDYCRKNDENSEEVCKTLLTCLWKQIEEKILSLEYSKSGGFYEYKCDSEQLVIEYAMSEGKGVQAQEVLDNFMKEKATESESVYQQEKIFSAIIAAITGEKEEVEILQLVLTDIQSCLETILEDIENEKDIAEKDHQETEELLEKGHELQQILKERQEHTLSAAQKNSGVKDIKQFMKHFPEHKTKIKTCLATLSDIADNLDISNKNGTIAKLTVSVANALGLIMSITGLLLGPVTAGVSTILSAVGCGIGITGGVTNTATVITKKMITSEKMKDVDKMFRLCSDEMDAIKGTSCAAGSAAASRTEGIHIGERGYDSISTKVSEAVQTVMHRIKHMIKNIQAFCKVQRNSALGALGKEVPGVRPSISKVVSNVDDVLSESVVAMSLTARIAGIMCNAVTLVFVAYEIAMDSKHIHQGARSEEATAIRNKIEELKLDLQYFSELYNGLQSVVKEE